MDLIDQAGHETQQLSNQATRVAARATSTAVKLSARVAAGSAAQTLRAIVALLAVARKGLNAKHSENEVSLRQFSRLADGSRDVVQIGDDQVARQLARELRRHGVLFSMEKHPDGSRTFHVQGKDASLIQHALSAAAKRIEDRLTKRTPSIDKTNDGPETPAADDERVDAPRLLELDEQQRDTLTDGLNTLATSGASVADGTDVSELAEQITRDGTVFLTPENVHVLDQALTANGWQVSSLEEAPEHMRAIVTTVDEERVKFETSAQAPEVEISKTLADAEQLRSQAQTDAAVAQSLLGQADAFDARAAEAGERMSTLREAMRSTATFEVNAAGEIVDAPSLSGAEFAIGGDGQAERTGHGQHVDQVRDEIAEHQTMAAQARAGASDMFDRSNRAEHAAVQADRRADTAKARLNATREQNGKRIDHSVAAHKAQAPAAARPVAPEHDRQPTRGGR